MLAELVMDLLLQVRQYGIRHSLNSPFIPFTLVDRAVQEQTNPPLFPPPFF